jgi:hypothetical protein
VWRLQADNRHIQPEDRQAVQENKVGVVSSLYGLQMTLRNPAKGDVFCVNCQRWLRHRRDCQGLGDVHGMCVCLTHTCYNRGEMQDADGPAKCLIIAFSRTGRKTHLAWARGLDMTADYALCGIGPVDLSIDRARWPLRCAYDREHLCKTCLDKWVRGPVYRDFP